MPVIPTYPGVYIDELASSVHTITGVPTAVAAFVGSAPRGPVDAPTHITSFADFERIYGGVSPDSDMSYGVYAFYLNGGSEAQIVRLAHAGAASSTITLDGTARNVVLTAASPGAWANTLRARVDYDTAAQDDGATTYNLTIYDAAVGTVIEQYRNIVADPNNANSLDKALAASAALTLAQTGDDLKGVLTTVPTAHPDPAADATSQDPFADSNPTCHTNATQVEDGGALGHDDYLPTTGEAAKTGIYQLLKTDIFNILCLPGALPTVLEPAAKLCADRRAMLIVDPPAAWDTANDAVTDLTANQPAGNTYNANAAVYFPSVTIADPAGNGTSRPIAPCGVMAGVWARTDTQRGVWKAPAGTGATLAGVTGLTVPMTDGENGTLNPLGVNCLRSFPVIGPVAWGARTLRGADRLTDQWKYLPVRRFALFLEESLYRGTQWAVFEPNDEPLWGAIRLNVGAFLNSLFKQGAFQGATAREAYLVKCDRENNPQNDIDRGILNILVGFAPLKPAEFVIIHIEQLAGQLQV